MAVYEAIRNLVQYGVNTALLQESDRIYATNQILEVLGLDEYEEPQGACREISLEETLDALLDYAHETGVLKEDGVVYRDLFDTKLMNCLMPRPSEVIGHFWKLYEESPEAATNYYYKLSQDSNYIRRYRVSKDMKWKTDTKYGELDITVNLSKRKIRRQSRQPNWQSRAVIRNASYARKMKAMPDVSTIRRAITTALSRSRSMTASGAFSIRRMCITMSTASCSTVCTRR